MAGEERARRLISEVGFNEETANAYVVSEGRCVYCGDDMFEFRQGYSSSQIDHLLPISKYPQLGKNIYNCVFCCSSCNSMKHKFDALKEGEDPEDKIENSQQMLIKRVQDFLSEKIEKRRLEYWKVKKILRDK